MRISKFLAGVAICSAASLLFMSCQKEESFHNPPAPGFESSNSRFSGAVEDDAALVSKVPMIVSSDFLKKSKTQPPLIFMAKGKPDNSPPSVTITAPASGAIVSGSVDVLVAASDNIGVSEVALRVDGSLVGNDNTAPYALPWNSATVSNGAHTLTVTARDAAGNIRSVSIQVMVSNVSGGDVTNPTVTITSPDNGSTVTGTVNIAVNATDNIGVSSVSFSVDGIGVSHDNTSPYNFSWNSSTVSTGIHTLTVTARDAAGNTASSSIQVTVNTIIVSPATLPSSYQLIMPPVGNQGSEGSCVSFAVGYAARSSAQFYKTNATGYSLSTNVFSPEFLYNQTKIESACGSGSSLLTALDFLKYVGICSWQSMPYSSSNGCALMPTSSQSVEASNYKIISYSGIYTSDLTTIKTMLSSRRPLLITFALDQSFYNAGPGFIWNRYSSSNGAIHAVAICGYDDSKHAVKVMNSWGSSWGDAGFSWIDYDFLPSLNSNVYVMNL